MAESAVAAGGGGGGGVSFSPGFLGTIRFVVEPRVYGVTSPSQLLLSINFPGSAGEKSVMILATITTKRDVLKQNKQTRK